MDKAQRNSHNTEEHLVVAYGPVLIVSDIMGTLLMWSLLASVLISLPHRDEFWFYLGIAVIASIVFPIGALQGITRKVVFTPSRIWHRRIFRKTIEQRISDLERLEKLRRDEWCLTFADGTRIVIPWYNRNHSRVPAFIYKHTDGRVEVSKD